MSKEYRYIFDVETCLYKDVCGLYKTDKCTPACQRYMEMDYLLYSSKIPKRLQKPFKLYPEEVDMDAFITLKEIKDNILDFVYKGENLYIYSSYTGNGKTSWAIKIMLKYFDEVWPGNGFRPRGIFIHVPEMLGQLKNFTDEFKKQNNELRQNLLECDLVVWDDIASTKLSEFDYQNLLTFIDHRVLHGKSNIYTGNIGKNYIVDKLGTRLASRIWNQSERVELKGVDRRGDFI